MVVKWFKGEAHFIEVASSNPRTRWIISQCCKNCILKRPKINEKWPEMAHFCKLKPCSD